MEERHPPVNGGYQRDAIDAGIIGGTWVFTALILLSVLQYRREP